MLICIYKMKKNVETEKNTEGNIIEKIYYNKLEELHKTPNSVEYMEIKDKIEALEKKILKNNNSNDIIDLMEYINERTSIENEYQFKLGFKTAMRIVIESLK